jgi:hypothetical protein
MRILFAVLVVGMVAFVFWRGWLQFHVTNEPGQTETTLTINKGKIKQDLNELKSREHAVSNTTPAPNEPAPTSPTAPASLKSGFAETNVHGRVQSVAVNQLMLLTGNGQTVRVVLLPTTTITIGGQVSRSTDIKVGDTVTVVQVMNNMGLVASSVTVEGR